MNFSFIHVISIPLTLKAKIEGVLTGYTVAMVTLKIAIIGSQMARNLRDANILVPLGKQW